MIEILSIIGLIQCQDKSWEIPPTQSETYVVSTFLDHISGTVDHSFSSLIQNHVGKRYNMFVSGFLGLFTSNSEPFNFIHF